MMDAIYFAMMLMVLASCVKGPRWATAAMAFVLPLSRRLPSVEIPFLNTENLIVLAPLLSLLISGGREKGMGRIRFVAPMVIFLLLVTASLITALCFYEPNRYFVMWRPYNLFISYKNLLICFVIYMLGCLILRRRDDLKIVLAGLAGGMAFESFFVVAEVVFNGPARANGHLFEANTAGAWLSWSFMAALGVVLVTGWKCREGRVALATAGASVVGLVFTLSRGNWISAVLSAGFVTLLMDRRILIVIILVLLAAPWWLPPSARARIDSTFINKDDQNALFLKREGSDETAAIGDFQASLLSGVVETDEGGELEDKRLDGSSQIRLFIWDAGLRMVQDFPLGVGYGLFPFYLSDYSPFLKYRAAHNTYIQVMTEIGIPGLLMLLTFLALLLVESWRVYRTVKDPLLRGLGLAALGSTLSMMVSVFFYNFLFIIQVNGQQWLLLGLMTQLRRIATVEEGEEAEAARVSAPGPEGATGSPTPAIPGETVPLWRLIS